jgi:hypothetical protein
MNAGRLESRLVVTLRSKPLQRRLHLCRSPAEIVFKKVPAEVPANLIGGD